MLFRAIWFVSWYEGSVGLTFMYIAIAKAIKVINRTYEVTQHFFRN